MPIPQLKPTWQVKKVGDTYKVIKGPAKKSWRKKITSFWLPALIIVILACGIFLVAAFAWFSRDLPDPNKIVDRTLPQSTKIYARDGTTLLYDIHGDQKRTVVNLEDIPNSMKWATIAVEDKDFYKEPGFNIKRIIKSIWEDIIHGGKVQGASTITQQFIKNAVLTSEKSYSRKIREIVLAYQLERKFTKDQILKLYFNEIPYGSTAYGVESAAQTFFGKSAKDLTLAESALLAALPQAPSYYSPYGSHTDDLLARQKLILSLMVEQGYITQEEADKAKTENVLSQIKPKSENILAPHFVMYVKEILADQYGEKTVEQGGLKVITTLDINKQKMAEDAISKYAAKNEKNYNAKNAALVSLDTKTGQILAMVGSRNYFDTANDGNVNVTIRPRQPGSSFKPIVYTAAFLKGYTPETILFDFVTRFKTDQGDYIPHNYDQKEHGPVTMRQALAGSLNIPAVQTLYLAGINNVLDLAQALGYSTFSDRSRFGLSLVLGGGEVTLLDHTSAYATLAREGDRHEVASILRVEDKNGKVLEEFKNQEKQVIDKGIVRKTTDILTDNNARAFIFGSSNYLTLPGRPVAAKTGTTNDYRDAWTLGYTPSIATGVWVGNNDNSPMVRGADGAIVAAPIWQDYMKRATAGPVEVFNKPAPNNATKPILKGQLEGEATVNVDKYTGKLIPDSCLSTYPQEYITQKTVRVVHSILFYVNKDDPNGPAPTDPTKDPQYDRFEEPVQKWAKANGYLNTMPATEDCNLRSGANAPVVTIQSPADGSTITTNTININVTISSKLNINKVDYFIDNNSIGETTTYPYSLTYDASSLESGFHNLKAEAHDAIENIGSANINFNFLVNPTSAILYITKPASNASLGQSEFPYTVSGFAFDPAGVQTVQFYYSLNDQPSLIGTISNPSDNTVSVAWPWPGEGVFKLYLVITNKNNEIKQSDFATVTLKASQ